MHRDTIVHTALEAFTGIHLASPESPVA